MIRLSRRNGDLLVANLEVIAYLERTPDTLVVLTNGDKFLVRESVEEVIQKAVEYRRQIAAGPVERVTSEP
ncbi:MAG: flagellar FlbD family protein [Deltaproteobacteria bacterium]|nr:flagellar FlbD family protein [Deltaproteobacteria bacterium]